MSGKSTAVEAAMALFNQRECIGGTLEIILDKTLYSAKQGRRKRGAKGI